VSCGGGDVSADAAVKATTRALAFGGAAASRQDGVVHEFGHEERLRLRNRGGARGAQPSVGRREKQLGVVGWQAGAATAAQDAAQAAAAAADAKRSLKPAGATARAAAASERGGGARAEAPLALCAMQMSRAERVVQREGGIS